MRTGTRSIGRDGRVPLLAVRHLSKRFGGAQALNDVSLTAQAGEVHGLLGQNGSGKSTLIKILAGFHDPEPGGELEINGVPARLPLRPGQFRQLGLSFVHQDLGLVPALTVAENFRIGELAARPRWHISWSRERRDVRAALERYGVDIQPDARVARLSQIDRARLAIVRAVEDLREHGDGAGCLLVLDEPTAFLPREGIEQLFELIRAIADEGSSVLFVSHDLNEVLRITDRVTVLRDGRVCGTAVTAEVSEGQLVEMIIGRRLGELAPHTHEASTESAVMVHGLTGGALRDVSLRLAAGEIVGLTGLLGSGFEELPYLLFGAMPVETGRLTLGQRVFELAALTPKRALRAGVALIPGDRQGAGSLASLPIVDNVTMLVLERFERRVGLDRRRMVNDAGALLERFDVRPPEPRLPYQALSGGNQQKALLAKWFERRPRLLLLHEPTQGVDVGARREIFALIDEAAGAGAAVLCASADYDQLAAICDRVVIVGRGRIVRELTGAELTKDRIAEQCLTSATVGRDDETGG